MLTLASVSFRSLVAELAGSDAQDAVVGAVNGIVKEIMVEQGYGKNQLVDLEKDATGAVTAVSTNVAAVNMLASEILTRAADMTAREVIHVGIPLGNLTGIALFLNRGPSVPVDVVMLSSSMADFRSELSDAGINQTRHRILLDLHVDVSLLMPWRTVSTWVDTEVLVSETVIVGKVPNSYMNWEN